MSVHKDTKPSQSIIEQLAQRSQKSIILQPDNLDPETYPIELISDVVKWTNDRRGLKLAAKRFGITLPQVQAILDCEDKKAEQLIKDSYPQELLDAVMRFKARRTNNRSIALQLGLKVEDVEGITRFLKNQAASHNNA